jgi:transcriptional regulator of NAD metabolism
MDENTQQLLQDFRSQLEAPIRETIAESEVLEIVSYPEDEGDAAVDETEVEIEALVQAAHAHMASAHIPIAEAPIGYVSNARNAASQSDIFQFWAPAEEMSLGIGSIVRHTATTPQVVHTYGIVIDTEGSTLGLVH